MQPAKCCSTLRLLQQPGEAVWMVAGFQVAAGWLLQHLSPLFDLRLQSFLSPGSSFLQALSGSPGGWEEEHPPQVEQLQELPDVGAAEPPGASCLHQEAYVDFEGGGESSSSFWLQINRKVFLNSCGASESREAAEKKHSSSREELMCAR